MLFYLSGTAVLFAQNYNSTLWYTYPAKDWKTQALHIGNAYMGASFYGGVAEERFDITEETMWFGGPAKNPDYNYGIIEGKSKLLPEIRQAIVEGDIEKADKLVNNEFCKSDNSAYGGFTSIGQLYVRFDNHDGEVSNYKRALDVSQSLATVDYNVNNVNYKREYFASHPARMMVYRFESDTPGKLGFSLHHDITSKNNEITVSDNEIHIKGKIDGNNHEYVVKIKVLSDGGKLSREGDFLKLSGANSATVYYTAATEYRPVGPLFNGANPDEITNQVLSSITQKDYQTLKSEHIADYKGLYDRVSLQMDGDPTLETLPTNERYEALKTGMTDDAGLKVLLFNLGRYLLISTSRSTTMPSGLQGLWIPGRKAAWNGHYQSNINLQEMYWTAGPLDLPECHESYINLIKILVEPGRKVAKEYYGTDGWVSHTVSDIWGFAAPRNNMLYGMYPSAGAWHCQHLWEHYEFTQDKTYLRDEAYPIMKEAAQFWLQNLVEYEGKLIIAPTVSAEHGVDVKDGKPLDYAITNGEAMRGKLFNLPGAYQDIQMVYDLFSNVILAADELNSDKAFIKEVKEKREQLLPPRIGKYGQLQEWAWDVDNPRNHHRHISHMYALMPGRQIDPIKTPDLAKAATKSLNMRGHTTYGRKWPHMGGNWNRTWRIWCFTRLGDGEKAARIYNDMVSGVGFENLMAHQSNNMQVDGSMSTPGFMAEMLLQSHQGEIHLLPALPVEWPAGKVTGLMARGAYKVDIEWRYGHLVSCNIESLKGTKLPPVRIMGELINPEKDERITIKTNN